VDPLAFLQQTINILADLLTVLIVLRVILSWFHHEAYGLTELLFKTTEPILGPIRRILPSLGVLDLSPLVALILLELLRNLLNSTL
jgi:YggT family protein